MAIKTSWIDVYESIVNVSHTGDTNWTTALNVTGTGIANIQLTGTWLEEIRITLDGIILVNGQPGEGDTPNHSYIYRLSYNASLLIEYRTTVAIKIAYCLIHYKNR